MRLSKTLAISLALLVCSYLQINAVADDNYVSQHQVLMQAIRDLLMLTSFETGVNELSVPVNTAMLRVPRHQFVPPRQRTYAYENRPLPIGYGQTISQPYIVALMTELLKLTSDDTVLEIGTGTGYQAAILAELASQVYTIEIVRPLGEQATNVLRKLQYNNVTTRIGDGYYGWKEFAPFDAIIVTAAASSIPPPLVNQLKVGGRMVIPVGGQFFTQQLMLVEKIDSANVKVQLILPVRFVPLTGDH